MSAKSKWCKYKKSKVQTWGPNGVGCGVQMGQVQTGLLYNNSCTCDVSKCKVSKNNCKSPKSKHGSKMGGVWGPNRAMSKGGYFTLTSIYNKSIVPSM